jgi:hypothetical protein
LGDLLEDVLNAGGPDERLGIFVPAIDVTHDDIDQFVNARCRKPLRLTLAQFTEEPFDQVQPGGTGRYEMEVHSRVLCQPSLGLRVLMRRVVVEDGVEDELAIHRFHHAPHEAQELLVAVSLVAIAQHLARGHVQGCEERCRAMPLVVVGIVPAHGPSSTAVPVACGPAPDLALLVHREDHRPLRRVDVKPDHVVQFLDELRVFRELERLNPMWLQAVRFPDASDAGRAHTDNRRQRPRAPVLTLAGL